MKPFEPIEVKASEIKDLFDESLAPEWYFRYSRNLEKEGRPEDVNTVAIYGLRRIGKTFASVMLAYKAQEYAMRATTMN